MKISESAHCIGCGYALRGLSKPVCPECGRLFDPDDATTFEDDHHRRSWRRWAKPPHLIHPLAAGGLAVAYLYWSSVPGGMLAGIGMSFLLVGPFAWVTVLALMVDWGHRAWAIRRDSSRASLERIGRTKRGAWRWAVTPLCLAMLISGMITAWPLRIRFALHRDVFEDAVRQIEGGADPATLTGKIAFFAVVNITLYGNGGVYFQTGMSGFDRVGVDYCSRDQGCQYGQWTLNDNWSADMN